MLLVAKAIAYGLLCVVLAIAAYTDWKSEKVYNWLTYPAILAGFIYWAAWYWALDGSAVSALDGLREASLGFAAGFFPFALIFAMGGLGGGDVKIMGAVGSLSANWEVVFGTAFYGLGIGFLMAFYLMIRHKLVRQTISRVATAVPMIMAKSKPEFPDDSPKIPLGVAFKLAFIVAGMEHMLDVQFPWTAYTEWF